MDRFHITSETISLLLNKHGIEKPETFVLPVPHRFSGYFRKLAQISLPLLFLCFILLWEKPGPISVSILAFCLGAFLIDYLFERYNSRNRYHRDLQNLSLLLEKEPLGEFYQKGHNLFTPYLTKDDVGNNSIVSGKMLYPQEPVRLAYLNRLIQKENIYKKDVLDACCGTGEVAKLYIEAENNVNMTELSQDSITTCHKKTGIQPSQAEVTELPFADNTFDVLNLTDILEHIDNPSKALKELFRVLRPGGKLILSVPNSQSPFLETVANPFNPLLFIERVLSFIWEKFLPPPRIMQLFEEDGQNVYVYHTAFSRTELRKLLKDCGFTVTWTGTYSFLGRGYSGIVNRLPSFLKESAEPFTVKTEKILENVPVLNKLGANVILLAKKQNPL